MAMVAVGEIDVRQSVCNPSRTPETGYRGGDFICAHAADRSLLKEGFTFAGATVNDFTSWFGSLKVGESREVVIRLDGKEHVAKVGNRGFDRVKWPDHPEMYQLRYNKTGTLAKALQEKFAATREIVAKGYFVQVSKRPCGEGEGGRAFALEDVGIKFDADDFVSDWQCARKASWS